MSSQYLFLPEQLVGMEWAQSTHPTTGSLHFPPSSWYTPTTFLGHL